VAFGDYFLDIKELREVKGGIDGLRMKLGLEMALGLLLYAR
jgi:hypothetical protein